MSDSEDHAIDFGDVVNAIERREMGRVQDFNLMLVGLKGIGKSSLVRSLFRGSIKPKEADGGPKLNEYSDILDEYGVKLRLTCIETSNFKTHDPELYVDYTEDKLKTYFVARQRQSMSRITDTRVHCCLYLIPLYGKLQLEDEDIECMKALHKRVNLIPIIPRSEVYEPAMRAKFKENILTDLKRHGIEYYSFSFDEREDEDRAKIVKQEAERFPFAVVAADEPIMENNRPRWIRKTGSCMIDIFDKEYDFDALSRLLIRHCMLNLIDSTHMKHYAKLKAELLQAAHLEGPKVLEDIGLDEHEICRIEYKQLLSGRNDKPTLKDLREEMETELEELRARVDGLKLRLKQLKANSTNSNSLHKSDLVRAKPPILNEKPEYLKQRVSNMYRR